MKFVVSCIKSVIVGAWILVAVLTTVCLISYNSYKVSEFGKYSLIIVDNKDLEPTYLKGDLVIVGKDNVDNYNVGDHIFFYNGNNTVKNFVNFGQITKVQKDNNAETSFYIGDTKISYSSVIGNGNGSIVYHYAGLVLSIFESRWGYMFLVILPTLFAFVYELYAIVMEIKEETKKQLKEEE